MKNVLKIALFSLAMVLGMNTMSAQALKQNQNSAEVTAKQETAELSSQLGLNGDQQRAVYRAIVVKENNFRKNIAGKDAKSADVIAAKEKNQLLFEESMKKVLTADQFKKWKTMQ